MKEGYRFVVDLDLISCRLLELACLLRPNQTDEPFSCISFPERFEELVLPC